MKEKYKPYVPTKAEARIDKVIGLFAPMRAEHRMQSRERMNYFRYLAAQSNNVRQNAHPSSSGETIRGSREKMQLMWNAIDMIDNSGLGEGMLKRLADYTAGTLRYQARTGDKAVNEAYESYLKVKFGKAIDYSKRFTLRQKAQLSVRSIALKGDVGQNTVREDSEIYFQGIEANRIGDPYNYNISNRYIRGIHIDGTGTPQAYDIYSQDRNSAFYRFEMQVPAFEKTGLPRFLFAHNPISYDDYRGVTLFKSAIDNITFLDQMRQYELQAMLWASSQSGVYKTKSGTLPEGLPFDENQPEVDASGNKLRSFTVRPNTVQAIGDGEDVHLFPNERPSPNVISMYHDSIKDFCVGTGFTFSFVYDATGLNGTAMRYCSSQDKRAIITWELNLLENMLDPIAMLTLGNGIANGEIPYHPNWRNGTFIFPPWPTVDAGRESAANINEVNAGINSGTRVAIENSDDIGEITKELSHETQNRIQEAKRIAKEEGIDDWREVFGFLKQGGGETKLSPLTEKSRADQTQQNPLADADKKGATSDGAELDEDEGGEETEFKMKGRDGGTITLRGRVVKKNGKTVFELSGVDDESRDDHGRWTEGGGISGAASHLQPTQKVFTESVNKKGEKVTSSKFLTHEGKELPEHLSKMKIPPAWTDVKISHDPNANLMIQGKDAKGRTQSVYSENHTMKQAAAKFARIRELSEKKDKIFKQNEDNLSHSDPSIRENAAASRLIHSTGIRPGSDAETGAEKKAYGATTLEGRHVTQDENGNVVLKFTGKKGVDLSIPVEDKKIAADLLERKKAAGDAGKIFKTDQASLGDYTHTLDGGGFKTKDFRTLKGTTTALDEIEKMPAPKSEKEYKKYVKTVASAVAKKLGNTPAIALQSYISPHVFEDWKNKLAA
jgi:DNA topoisomerase-1